MPRRLHTFGCKLQMPNMRSALIGRVAAVAIAAPWVSNCGGERNSPAEQQIISYASREPGSPAMPTNETSFQLLAADGPDRLANFQKLIVESGKPCDFVTSAVLKAGLEGTDEWRVKCANSGAWAVWFQSDGPTEFMQCSGTGCD